MNWRTMHGSATHRGSTSLPPGVCHCLSRSISTPSLHASCNLHLNICTPPPPNLSKLPPQPFLIASKTFQNGPQNLSTWAHNLSPVGLIWRRSALEPLRTVHAGDRRKGMISELCFAIEKLPHLFDIDWKIRWKLNQNQHGSLFFQSTETICSSP